MNSPRNALETLFEYIYHDQAHQIEGILPAAKTEFRTRFRDLNTDDKRKLNFLKSLLDYCDQGKVVQAKNQLEPAEQEYNRYLAQITSPAKLGFYQQHASQVFKNSLTTKQIYDESSLDQRKEVHWNNSNPAHTDRNSNIRSTPSKPRPTETQVTDTRNADTSSKILDNFEELYNNEWIEALKELEQLKIYERLAAQCLLRIVLDAYRVCRVEADNQILKMEDTAHDIMMEGLHDIGEKVKGERSYLIAYRKGIAGICIEKLQDTFRRRYLPEIVRGVGIYQNLRTHGAVHVFTNQIVSLCWWMVIQEHPMYLQDDRDSQTSFRPSLYRTYTRSGNSVDFYVWPPILDHRNGNVLSKGVAQGR